VTTTPHGVAVLRPVGRDRAATYESAIEHLQLACGIAEPVPFDELGQEIRDQLAGLLDGIGVEVRRLLLAPDRGSSPAAS
jgi:hypothetical protein